MSGGRLWQRQFNLLLDLTNKQYSATISNVIFKDRNINKDYIQSYIKGHKNGNSEIKQRVFQVRFS